MPGALGDAPSSALPHALVHAGHLSLRASGTTTQPDHPWLPSEVLPAFPSDPFELASLLAGYCSIACWICVFTPQLLQNYRRKSGDSLSVPFLVIWLLGDVFNVAGVILQKLLSTMLWLAIYYTLADIALILQIYYYRHCKRTVWVEVLPSTYCSSDGPSHDASHVRREYGTVSATVCSELRGSALREHTCSSPLTEQTASGCAPPIFQRSHPATAVERHWRGCLRHPRKTVYGLIGFTVGCLLVFAAMVDTGPAGDEEKKGGSYLRNSGKRARLSAFAEFPDAFPDSDGLDPLAQILGWISAMLYVGSRVPQMVKNLRNKTCEGLSFTMFGMAVLGNVTYTFSILIMLPVISASDAGGSRNTETYLIKTLPWLLGSTGTLVFDFIILAQFFRYQPKSLHANAERDESARLLHGDNRRL